MMRTSRTWLAVLAVTAAALGTPSRSRAEDAATDAGEAIVDGSLARDAAGDPAVLDVDRERLEVRALTAGELDPTIDPGSLFDVSLKDEDAVRVDAARLQALLLEVEAASRRAEKALPRPRARAGDAGLSDAGVNPALWAARIDLDRARLAFYELPRSRRAEILAAHAVLQGDGAVPQSEAQLREHEAENQRQEAMRAAQNARTDGERLVASDLARLLGVERSQAALREVFDRQKTRIAGQGDVMIGWQQRALEARARPGSSADATYDDLRRALRSARDALSTALEDLGGAPSDVPGPGADPLESLHIDVDTSAARQARDRVEAEARRLGAEEESLRRERAAQLFDEIDTLNGERLSLLDALSPEKRGAVTGFTQAGWDQAVAEVRQLTLILRYHRYIIGEWLLALRHPGRAIGRMLAGGAVQLVEWILALGVFLWWRRRSPALLRLLHGRAVEDDRRSRRPTPSPATRALAIVAQVHRPLEWLALLLVLQWLLPATTQQVLEIRVLLVLMMWIFGAGFIVDAVNALAGGRSDRLGRNEPDSAVLRLRSLRLVSRVVVIFGLILVISSMLVGHGTIYHWVFSTCWLASIPLLLVLVRWWRGIVFRRTERARKRSRIQQWVLANSQGWWTSFAAAAVGGVCLFASGAARGARNWIGRFVVTRRALAYLFRRQLDKREQMGAVGPIPATAFEALGPEHPSAAWISNASDESIRQVAARVRDRKGGVVAIVGERGMGKTAALRRLCAEGDDTILIDVRSSDGDILRARFAESAGLPRTATLEDAARAIAASTKIHALVLDNAHRFVRPVVGGLRAFDPLLATASRHTSTTTWVLAFDRIIWQFLERSRGARPLFDEVVLLEPWAEDEIARLLQARNEQAGLSPSFESLLEPLPASADEVDKQEALAQRAADYYRLLWDAATGNPGVALHMWRRSLGTDASGQTAVRPSTALDLADLERLPDSSVFVLRAVLQLAPVLAEDIAKGSLLRLGDVAEALRYAESRGYIEDRGGGYRVTWTWFRAITLFLQRKHLLVTR